MYFNMMIVWYSICMYVCVFCGVAAFSHEGDNPILNLAQEAKIILYHILMALHKINHRKKGKTNRRNSEHNSNGIHVNWYWRIG